MNWGGLLRVIAPRLIGAAASGLAGFVFTKTKGAVTLDPTQLTELGTTMILTYGMAHTAAAAKLNPAQAATPTLATQGKVDQKLSDTNETPIPYPPPATPTIVNNQGN